MRIFSSKVKTILRKRTVRIKAGKGPEGYGAQKSRRVPTFFCDHRVRTENTLLPDLT